MFQVVTNGFSSAASVPVPAGMLLLPAGHQQAAHRPIYHPAFQQTAYVVQASAAPSFQLAVAAPAPAPRPVVIVTQQQPQLVVAQPAPAPVLVVSQPTHRGHHHHHGHHHHRHHRVHHAARGGMIVAQAAAPRVPNAIVLQSGAGTFYISGHR